MTAIQVAKLAKQQGYALAVNAGLFQLQRVMYSKNGISSIERISAWLPLENVVSILKGE
jgi:hypothetical protein